tara:strand:- start:106 stop:639 length:534 start_codon:yes stop_codon:yes gene_type:complete
MFGLLAPCNAALAAEDTAEENEPENEAVITLEQIIVTGQRSLFLLRAQIESARESLYSSYNDFNVDDEFDVNCQRVTWTGTHIPEQQCWPAFFERLVAENSQDSLIGIGFLIPAGELANLYAERFDELRVNLEKVAGEPPPVADAMMELGKLEQALALKREECMRKPAFLLIFRRCN